VSEIGIDEVILRAHQFYGPPPKYLTYISEIELSIGAIDGKVTDGSFKGLKNWFQSFQIHYSDYDNDIKAAAERMNLAMADYSLLFTRIDLRSVKLQIHFQDQSDFISILNIPSGVHALFDSMIDEKYESQWRWGVPELEISLLNRVPDVEDLWIEVGYGRTSVQAVQLHQYPDWERRMEEQQKFLRQQDRFSNRCPFLYLISDSGTLLG
jgi:hypothetical protein